LLALLAKRFDCETVSTDGNEIASGVVCDDDLRKYAARLYEPNIIAEIQLRDGPRSEIAIEKNHLQWFTRVTHSGPVCRARTGKRYVRLSLRVSTCVCARAKEAMLLEGK